MYGVLEPMDNLGSERKSIEKFQRFWICSEMIRNPENLVIRKIIHPPTRGRRKGAWSASVAEEVTQPLLKVIIQFK